jgi:hypothetical protein
MASSWEEYSQYVLRAIESLENRMGKVEETQGKILVRLAMFLGGAGVVWFIAKGYIAETIKKMVG